MNLDAPGPLSDTMTRGRSCRFCCGTDLVDDPFRRSVLFGDLVRRYTRCRQCGSRSLTPMPNNDELADLYTVEYFKEPEPGQTDGQPRAYAWVLDNLPEPRKGLFVDMGCGDGELLLLAADRGYEVVGLDVDQASVEAVRIATGCPAVTFDELPSFVNQAAAVHLGDVLEHVADPELLVREAISLLRPGGLLLVQGPLEANRSPFNVVLAVVAICKRSVPTSDPPHHVHLVSPRGQECFFRRLGFETLDYRLSDVNWPAPQRFGGYLLKDPRLLTLYVCRRLSSVVRPIAPRLLSNRFEYIGRYAE